MQKIIPFKKEMVFQNTIDEITSISMDHHLSREDYTIKGNFIVEGEYAYSNKKDKFSFEIPYSGTLEENYEVENAILDIDDFYYEIVGPNKVSIHIDILVDKLSEKPLLEEVIEDIPMLDEEFVKEDRTVEEKEVEVEQVKEERLPEVASESEEESETERVENVVQVFSNTDSMEESYMTYRVYIVREGHTVSSILEKYQITEDSLRKYNVINELTLGEKLIIPNEKN